jgi:hypothetical protein
VTSPPLMADENSEVGKSCFEKFCVVNPVACKSPDAKAINSSITYRFKTLVILKIAR